MPPAVRSYPRSLSRLNRLPVALLHGTLRLLVIVLFTGLPEQTNSRDCPGTLHGTLCYVYSAQNLTWDQARDFCVTQQNGRLPVIENAAEQTFLRNWLAVLGADVVWLDGKETTRDDWHWLDGSYLALQGCYTDNGWSRDLPTAVAITDLVPELCVTECRGMSFAYAGVQSRTNCYCGDSYGAHGREAGGCEASCPGNNQQTCGGFGSNAIYRVDGTSGQWKYQNPNDATGYETCGAIASAADGRDFIDRPCYDKTLYYICDLYDSSSGCSEIEQNHCIYIGTKTLTWFEARADCASRGGDLVQVGDVTLREGLITHMGGGAADAGGLYWIGLVQSEWQTHAGDPLLYTAWASTAPDQEASRCLASSKLRGYKWDDVECTSTQSVACKYETIDPPTTTVDVTSTTSISESTTTTTSDVTTTSGELTSAIVASTSGEQSTAPSTMETDSTTSSSNAMTSPGNSPQPTTASDDVITTSASDDVITTSAFDDVITTTSALDDVITTPSLSSMMTSVPTTSQPAIHPCSSNPCQHGATCDVTNDVIDCQCPGGFNGDFCESDINECASTPCLNVGTCRDGVNAYTCSCAASFTGEFCQHAISNETSPWNNATVTNATIPETTDNYISTPSGGQYTPEGGASTGGGSDGNWTIFQICLVVAVLVLILAIIIAVVVFVYFKKSDNNVGKVRPSKDYGETGDTGLSPVDTADSETDLVMQ